MNKCTAIAVQDVQKPSQSIRSVKYILLKVYMIDNLTVLQEYSTSFLSMTKMASLRKVINFQAGKIDTSNVYYLKAESRQREVLVHKFHSNDGQQQLPKMCPRLPFNHKLLQPQKCDSSIYDGSYFLRRTFSCINMIWL